MRVSRLKRLNASFVKSFSQVKYILNLDFVKYKQKLYDTKDFIKPAYKNYITLESAIADKTVNKVMFYVNLETKQNIRIVI